MHNRRLPLPPDPIQHDAVRHHRRSRPKPPESRNRRLSKATPPCQPTPPCRAHPLCRPNRQPPGSTSPHRQCPWAMPGTIPVPGAVSQVGPALHAAPRDNAPDSLASLQTRLPVVDLALFRAIRLQPENIIKLSSSFCIHGTSCRQETVTLGPYVIPTIEKDAEAADYR